MANIAYADYPYRRSSLAKRTQAKPFWSVLDLDGSFAAGSLAARMEVHQRLRAQGSIIFSTARSPELVMSSNMLDVSQRLGEVARQAPKWHVENGVYSFVPIETLDEFRYCYNPDAILAFGEGIFIKKLRTGKQRPSYFSCDTEYERIYLNQIAQEAPSAERTWRKLALAVVKTVGLEEKLAAIEIAGNYERGLANVTPLKYRIQLDFRGRHSVSDKYIALERIKNFLRGTPLAQYVEGVDESKPDMGNPDESRATLYLMPPGARKENMLNRTLSQICTQQRIGTHEMKLLIVGDTLTDFYSMCYAGWDASAVGIVVGGSRLFQCLEERANFAGVDLQRYHKALKPTSRPGFYRFDNPLMRGGWTEHGKERLIILGDRAYPGTVGAETVLAYLNDTKIHNQVDEKLKALAIG